METDGDTMMENRSSEPVEGEEDRASKRQRIEGEEGEQAKAPTSLDQSKIEIQELRRRLKEAQQRPEEQHEKLIKEAQQWLEKHGKETQQIREETEKRRKETQKIREETEKRRKEAEEAAEKERAGRRQAEEAAARKLEEERASRRQAEEAAARKLEEAKKRRKEAEEAAEEARLAAEKARLHNSVKELLDNGVPSMHEMKGSASVFDNKKARMKVEHDRKKVQEWIEEKEKNPKTTIAPPKIGLHELAEIKRWTIPKNLLEFQLNLTDGKGLPISSVLQTTAEHIVKAGKLPHYNVRDPEDYVQAVIRDVLHCLGVKMEVFREATLFSLRADLVVVIYEGRLIFAVEIENPGQTGQKVETSEKAGGHCLDYLKGMKQQGLDQPFVLLSTYNSTSIVRLPDQGPAYSNILAKGAKNAQDEPKKRHTARLAEPKPTGKAEAQSPSQGGESEVMRLPQLSPTPDLEEEQAGPVSVAGTRITNSTSSAEFDFQGRQVEVSQTYAPKDLYNCVALLIESALVSYNQSKGNGEKAKPPKPGGNFIGELCTLYDNGYKWEKVTITGFNYNEPPRFQKGQKFHIHSVLGQGNTLLCASTTGRAFVAKLFLTQPSYKYDAEEREKENKQRLEFSRLEAESERDKWKVLGPPGSKGFCEVLTLNNLPALTMPFFPPIPFEHREKYLTLIETRLKEVGEKGYVYEEVCWGHFGVRGNQAGSLGDVTLLGLGSMSGPSEENKNCYEEAVQKQINSLRTGLGTVEKSHHGVVLV